MSHSHLVWANLKRKKLRTVLTFLSVLVAFGLYGLLSAIKTGLSQGVEVAGADRLVVRHKVSIIQLLPESYQSRLEEIEGVELAVFATWFGGYYQDPRQVFGQFPVEPRDYFSMYPELLLPEEAMERWLKTQTGAVVGRKLAERYGWTVGDRIPIQATIWRKENGVALWEFDLVGIYDGAEQATDTGMFFFRYDYFDEARAFGKGEVGWYVVKVADPARGAEVAETIDETFANSFAETKTETEKAFAQSFAEQIGDISTIVASIMGAVFFTILLIAGNTMAQSVRERTRELGVMKALGFSRGRLMGLVLAEAFFLSVGGGLTGLALGWWLIGQSDAPGSFFPVFYLPGDDVIIGVLISAGLGLLTGLLPAWQAMRLPVAEAIRRT